MRRLRFAPAARSDLHELAGYIAARASVTVAVEVVERIRSRCKLIADTPGEIGTPRPEIIAGIRSYAVPPFVLFFRYSGDEAQVARILHERQDIEEVFRSGD